MNEDENTDKMNWDSTASIRERDDDKSSRRWKTSNRQIEKDDKQIEKNNKRETKSETRQLSENRNDIFNDRTRVVTETRDANIVWASSQQRNENDSLNQERKEDEENTKDECDKDDDIDTRVKREHNAVNTKKHTKNQKI